MIPKFEPRPPQPPMPFAQAQGLDVIPAAEQARRWREELDALASSHSQIAKSGLLVTLACISIVTLVLVIPWLVDLNWGSTATGPALVATFLFSSTLGWWVWWRQSLPPIAASGFVVAVVVLFVHGAWVNGTMALVLLAPSVIVFHVLMRPGPAVWASAISLLVSIVVLLWQHQLEPALFVRVTVGAISATLFMQLITRHWSEWTGRVSKLGWEFHRLVDDVEKRRELAETAYNTALLTDSSSGLPNAEGFLAQGSAFLSQLEPPGRVALVSVRVRGWADTCTRWDSAVQRDLTLALAERFRSAFADDALVGRTAADDFLVLFAARAAGQTADILKSITERGADLEHPISVGAARVLPHPRVGVALHPEHATNLPSLLRGAVMAREYAVEHALPWPAVYNLGMDHDIDDEAVLFSDIVGELAREGFVLHWQPLAEPGGRKVSKAEALIRWQHPQRGWVPPGSFIPLLERSALIVEFTDWVLRCAAVQVIQWRRTLHPQFQVSVNVPASYLARCCDQPEEMLARLASLELPAGAMVLEVTEGVLLDMTPEMQHTLTMVKGMGFLVALDDFGIGYSSFAMLEKLDLDFVKLDKSFVDDIEQRPSRRAICEAIISMVHRLGAKVVAEGVEQPGQLKWLSMMGVDYVQGFLLAKPMTAAALQDWAHARAGS